MYSESQNSAKFIRELAELAYRITEMEVLVASLHTDFSFAQSWTLEVRKEGVALRFAYDSRDCELCVERSPVDRLAGPNEWKREGAESFDRGTAGEKSLRFVEDYVAGQFQIKSTS